MKEEVAVLREKIVDLEKENKELKHDLERLTFICDFYYEALGPANDEIAEMAEAAWQSQ